MWLRKKNVNEWEGRKPQEKRKDEKEEEEEEEEDYQATPLLAMGNTYRTAMLCGGKMRQQCFFLTIFYTHIAKL